MSQLPTEIYGRIMEFTDGSRINLLNFIRCSWSALIEGERVLYRKVRIRNAQFGTLNGMLDGVIANPSRARLIRDFFIETGYIEPDLASKLRLALQQMENLQSLTLIPLDFPFSTVFDPLTTTGTLEFPFKLIRFRYEGQKSLGLPSFFASQPSIRHLHVKIYRLRDKLPLKTLPNLQSLKGPAALVIAFATPARPIPRLSWSTLTSYSLTETPNGPPNLSLLALKIHFQTPDTFNLSLIAPNLQYLELLFYKFVRMLLLTLYHYSIDSFPE